MKLSTIILLATFVLLLTTLFATNIILKKEYNRLDKSDSYWTYDKILEQPFQYLKIEGGNNSHIVYQQSASPSVRVSRNWTSFNKGSARIFVKNDTLFLKFPTSIDVHDLGYLKWNTPFRIFSPRLVSIDGLNTNFELQKLKQNNITINLKGRSRLEVESYQNHFDTIHITQQDSSEVIFEISPDLKGKTIEPNNKIVVRENLPSSKANNSNLQKIFNPEVQPSSWETLYVENVQAKIQGLSILDLGHAQIKSLQLNISDTSAIILAGSSLLKLNKK